MVESRTVAVVLFEGFELLDVFGPVELLSVLPDDFTIVMLGPTGEPVASHQGTRIVPDTAYTAAPAADIVLVPGGFGTRPLVTEAGFLTWLRDYCAGAEVVASVCTGSALLAAAGLLDGHRATTNKRAYSWVTGFGRDVDWQPVARWVEDGSRWTSSGVAAGMDMTAALISALTSPEHAREACDFVELDVHTDPGWDPFAARNGLVPDTGDHRLGDGS
ncbi:DJ-1/PfpI family protein [Brevibacterium luteolum]|nr:DJ-1/PfpI family protein [Brevibacterium luteolum]MBU8577928.1 DJ-1/PfpI family protein [Brevibacterium luteolum]